MRDVDHGLSKVIAIPKARVHMTNAARMAAGPSELSLVVCGVPEPEKYGCSARQRASGDGSPSTCVLEPSERLIVRCDDGRRIARRMRPNVPKITGGHSRWITDKTATKTVCGINMAVKDCGMRGSQRHLRRRAGVDRRCSTRMSFVAMLKVVLV